MRLNQEARIHARTLRELEGAMQLRELSQMHVKGKCHLSQMLILYSLFWAKINIFVSQIHTVGTRIVGTHFDSRVIEQAQHSS